MTYTPKIGGSTNQDFPLQFTHGKTSSISLSCTPIYQLSNDGNDTVISHGSGCFWRHDQRLFLITARHVLSGLSPFDDSLMSKNGYIPRKISVFASVLADGKNWERKRIDIEVTKEDKRLWLEDPEFEVYRTDIAALEIGLAKPAPIFCLNDDTNLFNELLTMVGSDCVIAGYPNTNIDGLMLPIWRRGTIASEPKLPIDGKPLFLVDASTSPGFSGAPVFRRHVGPLPVEGTNGTYSIKIDNIVSTWFIGVYAGRLQHKHFGGEVPFVFYGNRLSHILARA